MCKISLNEKVESWRGGGGEDSGENAEVARGVGDF